MIGTPLSLRFLKTVTLPSLKPQASSLKPRVLLVAGEASGDVHGADLVAALKKNAPDIEVFGVGGQYLREAGMHTLVDTAAIAGMGLFEARDKLRALIRAYRQLTHLLRTTPPDLLILIDFPEFNLRLAKVAKQVGVKVFYYISPQVWAWRKRRVHTIAKRVDRLAAIFPFESAFYAAHGCHVDFVGHPLVDRVRPTRAREDTLHQLGLDPTQKTIALLPGSRAQEVRYLLPPMIAAAKLLGPSYQFVLAVASTLDTEHLARQVGQQPIPIIQGDTYNIVHAADFAMVASGTATLETALLERPMVIVYRLAPVTYALARLIVRVPFIGMPNLIAERRVVPELVQRQVTPERIATEVRRLLDDPQAYRVTQEGLREVRRRLGSGGAAERAAQLALDMLAAPR
ncbi:MAG: lipid-A-disaccharide synthase [Deltaproteobacteria bacterium]|nr:lipid-A-disaccharide synthase [Deltaproteobacteria bacterium]